MNPNVELRNFLRLAACRSERKANDIKAKYDNIKVENENLKKKKHLLSQKLENYNQIQSENNELKKSQQEMSQKLENLTSKNSQLKAKLKEANAENNKRLNAHNIDAAKIEKLVNENSHLKESVDTIQNKLRIKKQNYIAAIEEANKGRKCDKSQVENKELKKSQQEMSQKLEDLASKNDQLTKNYNQTKIQLEKISSEKSKLLEAHNIGIANLETLSEENSTLKASVDQLKHQFGITEEMYLARIEKANNDLQQMKQLKIDLETQMQNMSVKQQLISTACQTDEWRVNANTKKVTSTNFVLRNKKTVITGSKSVSEKTAGSRQQPSVRKPAWKF